MRFPWANVALLLFLSSQLITGYYGFINGRESNSWLLWLHGIGAYAIAVVLFWKGAIILDVYRRGTSLNWRRLAFGLIVLLLVATLLSGLLWTFVGPRYFLGFSLVTLHIFLAVTLIVLVGWHILHFRWILRTPRATGRRAFLRTSVAGLLGLFLWRTVGASKVMMRLPGARRRFTGSYEIGSFTGQFPQVSWIADRPPPVEVAAWQLFIRGEVERPLIFTYAQLLELADNELEAVLDCTGGWYSAQLWRGISVDRLLQMAGVHQRARSVTFEAVSGYKRRFWLREARNYLLATHVADQTLGHAHGFPIRLVAPGQRGVNWVKWVTTVRVNASSKHWQLPLPIQ